MQLVHVLVLLALVCCAVERTQCCSCNPMSVYTASRVAGDVIQVTVGQEIGSLSQGVSSFDVKITFVFQGCLGTTNLSTSLQHFSNCCVLDIQCRELSLMSLHQQLEVADV